jgi:hypothetical protein
MRHACRVRHAVCRHHLQQAAMQPARRLRGKARSDGKAGQLVAEAEQVAVIDEDRRSNRLVDRPVRDPERPQQCAFHATRLERSELEKVACFCREASGAREDRVAHGQRDGCRGGGEHLGDVERIAPGDAVQLTRIDVVPVSQLPHCVGGEGLDGPALQVRRGQVTEHATERMRRVDLVGSQRAQDQRRRVGDAPSDEAQEVERRLVGPVQILHDGECRRAQVLEERIEDVVDRCSLGQPGGGGARAPSSHVGERPKGPWSRECVAGTPEDSDGGLGACGDRAQDGRLPDTGLAFKDDEAARSPRGRRQGFTQVGEQFCALEEFQAQQSAARVGRHPAVAIGLVRSDRRLHPDTIRGGANAACVVSAVDIGVGRVSAG